MTIHKRLFSITAAAIAGGALLILSGCSGDSSGGPEAPAGPPLEEQVAAFYAANPDKYTFATPEDLPKDLVWENGMDLPEIGSPKAKKGGTYHYFVNDFPRTVRYVGPDASGAFRGEILDYNAITLVHEHPDLNAYHPALAKEWAVGEDGRTVYFRLDPDARYSDGNPVIARDFMFAFFFMQSKHIKDPWYNDYYKTKFLNITRYDDRTLSLTYHESKPDVIYRLGSFRPVPQHFYEEFGEDYVQRYQFRFEPTTGPYESRPEYLKKGRSITLTKVKDFWAADKKYFRYRFNPDYLAFQVIRDPNKAIESFKRGDIDWHRLTLPKYWYEKIPDDLPEVQDGYIQKATFYNDVPPPSWALRINTSKPLLDNIDIRKGLHHATNFELVIAQNYRGDAVRMKTMADGHGEFSHPTIKAREFSIEKAAEYFAKAGFTKRGPDGIFVNDKGQRLSFTITTGYKRMTDVLTVLEQEAAKAGVEYKLEILEQTAGWKKAHEKKHDITLSALNISVEMYPRFWESYYGGNAYEDNGDVKVDTNNTTQTNVAEINDLIDRYRASGDADEIKEISHTLIEKLHEHACFIPGWVQPYFRGAHWRWMRFPDGFDERKSREIREFRVYWIDEDIKEETLAARKKGQKFPVSIKEYDQHKEED